MPHALVTGAASGIGCATSLALLKSGWQVTACGRSLASLEHLRSQACNGDRLALLAFDLADPEAVERAALGLLQPRRPIDLLVNCAGVQLWHLTRTARGIEIVFATNVLAPFLLMSRLAPALPPAALVLNIGSMVHRWARLDPDDLNHDRRPFAPNAAYYQSKLALMLVSAAFARRLAAQGVTVWALEPGMTRTDFPRHFRGFSRLMAVLWRPLLRRPEAVAAEVVGLASLRRDVPGQHLCWSRGRVIPLSSVVQDAALQEAVLASCARIAESARVAAP